MPKLEEWEIKKYWEIFQGLEPVSNKLSGNKVSVVFKNSRLDTATLSKIWDLADVDLDGELDFEEFCIAMRLIFDMVNKTVSSVPDSLPEWLVPGSKAHLIKRTSSVEASDDEDLSLSDEFDWYISPNDKATYESIYSSSCDPHGRIGFKALEGLYNTLSSVPQTDISSAWNLVNPRQSESIDKDQCIVFLHMVNQRSHGKRIPRGVPASLRATFSKENPEYDVNSHQGKQTNYKPSSKSFGDEYLNRMGVNSSAREAKGTDFTSTESTDWEEVRLRRQLQELESRIFKAEQEAKRKVNPNPEDDALAMERYELEQLLKYKDSQLEESQKRQETPSEQNLDSIASDVALIEQQVQTLEEHLRGKNGELDSLRKQIQQVR